MIQVNAHKEWKKLKEKFLLLKLIFPVYINHLNYCCHEKNSNFINLTII